MSEPKQPYRFEYSVGDYIDYFDVPPPTNATFAQLENWYAAKTPTPINNFKKDENAEGKLHSDSMIREARPLWAGRPHGLTKMQEQEDQEVAADLTLDALRAAIMKKSLPSETRIALALGVLDNAGLISERADSGLPSMPRDIEPDPLVLIEQMVQRAPDFLTPIEKKKHYEELAKKLVDDCTREKTDVFLWVLYLYLNSVGYNVGEAPRRIRQALEKK